MARIRPAKSQGGDSAGDGDSPKLPARRTRPSGESGKAAARPEPRPRSRPKTEKAGSVTKAVVQNRRGSRFFSEVVAELRKVQWPTRSQLLQSTGVVLLVVTIITIYLAIVDSIFERVVNAIF